MKEPETPIPSLRGRTALVTGGARRIGRQLALALGREGARVAVHFHRSESEATSLVAELREMGAETMALGGDLTDPAVASSLVDRVAAALGPVDVLVNNASIFAPGEALATTLAEWQANLAIHATAPLLLSQGLARQLPAGSDGVIINLNDWRAGRPGPDHFAYTISKVALHGMTASLAQAFGPRGIRVCELALGAVMAPAAGEDGYLKTLRQEIPTRRFPSVDDVATALVFLVRTPSVNGVTLPIDGGRGLA